MAVKLKEAIGSGDLCHLFSFSDSKYYGCLECISFISATSMHLPSACSVLHTQKSPFISENCQVGQKDHLGFSITSYGCFHQCYRKNPNELCGQPNKSWLLGSLQEAGSLKNKRVLRERSQKCFEEKHQLIYTYVYVIFFTLIKYKNYLNISHTSKTLNASAKAFNIPHVGHKYQSNFLRSRTYL